MAQHAADRPTTPTEAVATSDPFVARYAAHVDPVLLGSVSSGDPAAAIAAMAGVHREIAEVRSPGETCVEVRDGALHVVADDRPFLVDSVLGTLVHDGVDLGLMLHPRFLVRRDGGRLTEVLDVGVGGRVPAGAVAESWIRVEIDPDADEDAVVASVRGTLRDVTLVVEDWQPMREGLLALAERMTGPGQLGEDDERRSASDFLRWLAEDHFTFLGSRDHLVAVDGAGTTIRAVPGTGLGVLRADGTAETITPLATGEAQGEEVTHPVSVGKSEEVLRVHRVTHPDLVAVRFYDDEGRLIERRYAGHFASTAYTSSVLTIPLVRDKVAAILDGGGWSRDTHSGSIALRLLETFPRDELFQAPTAHLAAVVTQVLRLANSARSAVFLRHDAGRRFVTALVYLPREQYTTSLRRRVEELLTTATGADETTYTAHVSDAPYARLYYILRCVDGAPVMPDGEALTSLRDGVTDAARTWEERLRRAADRLVGPAMATALLRPWRGGYPADYIEDFDPAQAVADLKNLARLEIDGTRFACALYDPRRGPDGGEDDPRVRRLKIFSKDTPTLTEVLPVFADLGLDVLEEEPYTLTRVDGTVVGIFDFAVRLPDAKGWERYSHEEVRRLVEDAVTAVRVGATESDALGALVIRAGLTWRQVALLRALLAYLRQAGTPYDSRTLIGALVEHQGLAADLVELFETRFDPERFDGVSGPEREAAEQEVLTRMRGQLDEVASLDHDRVLRSLVGIVRASIRTSYFVRDEHGEPLPRLSIKLLPAQVPDLPKPHPAFEIWVHGPEVEGVHLRFGAVARGGLRWSDRRDDFRTEILGLVKAQQVKNAVIVPTGSKGGFYPKQLPDQAADRDAWLAAGRSAYRTFIRGLLDLTDNRVDGEVRPPARVVRHDGDDPYLVVAADKGTATFSDLANEVSREYGFWLDDAFASGGSVGYDHKAMGITARGAWISVQRHFRELGHDTQTQDLTAVGIGDMSGDVFGNGMLLSEHIRLVAAFDHRHVFLDPSPDAATSYAERRRLFALERSSWQDYDPSLISTGGGVWPRSAKSVPVSEEARVALGLPEGTSELTPSELIHGILQAPVDLLWNGGIGTYVKAAEESDDEVGDRANDAIRIDGSMLRARVVGEGGNLGATQRGRIEAARAGVALNTDAIDNSAGVDTSDHEVNIKILLGEAMAAGDLDPGDRPALLTSMTDEVAQQVLRDNIEQNVLLGNARAQGAGMLRVHARLMSELERRGELDREVEDLPGESEIAERLEAGQGLTSPELAVLVAYAKLSLTADLLDSDLPDDPATQQRLVDYFPTPLRERFAEQVAAHPLRREIVATAVAGDLVNRGGITFVQRAVEETAAQPVQIARAYLVARAVFDLPGFVAQVEALDGVVDTGVQTRLLLEFRRLLDRTVRWLLAARPGRLDVATEIGRLAPVVGEIGPRVPDLLCGAEAERFTTVVGELEGAGVPSGLARTAASLLDLYSVLDVTDLALETGEQPLDVAQAYYAVSEAFAIDELLGAVSALPREERWDAMARAALREDLYATLRSITASVLESEGGGEGAASDRLSGWVATHEEAVERARTSIATICELPEPTIAALSVALRTVRTLAR